jgi:hypothetical protein
VCALSPVAPQMRHLCFCNSGHVTLPIQSVILKQAHPFFSQMKTFKNQDNSRVTGVVTLGFAFPAAIRAQRLVAFTAAATDDAWWLRFRRGIPSDDRKRTNPRFTHARCFHLNQARDDMTGTFNIYSKNEMYST